MESNVKIEVLDIFSHIDSRAAIIVADGNAGYNGTLHVFLTNESLAAWLGQMRSEHPDTDFRYVEDYLGTAVNFVIWNDLEGLSLHSVADSQFDVSKADLEPLTDLLDSFSVMSAVNRGRMPIADAASRMKNKEIFFVGELPSQGSSVLERRNTVYGSTTIKRGNADGSYDAVTAFLTRDSALRFANASVPVSQCKLSELAAMWNYLYPIIIEPKRSFCIEFAPVSLASMM